MRHAISPRFPPLRLGIVTVGVLIAAWVSAPATLPAQAQTADRTVTLTLRCTAASCNGGWDWYQGSSPALGSGKISGIAGQTLTATTTQPAAADTLDFAVGSGPTNTCVEGFFEYFTPGSAINFTATIPKSKVVYHRTVPCSGAGSTFTMQS